MQHTCADCDHKFFDQGQSQDSISPAVQCPRCHSYRTQPDGIPDEANDMLHGLGAMPDSTQDDMSGNPLQEGIMGDYQNRDKRDEAFSSVRARISLFETPEFETTGLIAPPDLYRHGLETEGSHRTGLQIPKGITDNLHATLGNLQAWVENPYENGALRPYYNQYWKVIRPSFMKPGSLQIGVADPTMAEIINHVAQTDDMTPLYEYRGVDPHTAKTALFGLPGGLIGDAAGALGLGALNLIPGVGEVADAAALGDAAAAGGEAAAGAGAAEGAAGAAGDSSASGVGGVMDKVKNGIQKGVGIQLGEQGVRDMTGGGGNGGGGQVSDPGIGDAAPKDFSSYASVLAHDVPSFDPNGPGMKKFKLMLPLLQEMITNGEDGSQDPLVDGLHQSLEAEIPGYMDHADPAAGDAMLLKLQVPTSAEHGDKPKSEEKPDKDTHESRTSQTTTLDGDDLAEFLPALEVSAPWWRDPPSQAKTTGFVADLFGGAAGGGEAAAAGAEGAAGGSAGAVGGMMGRAMGGGAKQLGQGLNYVDDFLGGGASSGHGAGGHPGAGGGRNDMSFYTRNLFASDEDDAHPEAHDEIPKNEDGDSQQKTDGNSHEWQRDLSVDDQGGGATHAPNFDPAGPGMARLKLLAPLLIQMIEGGEDGSQDPLVLGLHETLDHEIPGYLDHGDDAAADQLIATLKGQHDKTTPDAPATHADENSGGKHEGSARVADTQGPQTPEQIKAVQEFLLKNGPKMGLEGDELMQTMLSVPTNPLEFADILAEIQQATPPPAPPTQPQDAGMSTAPPAPAQEEAPPEGTMPMPGMSQQMASAVQRYADLEPGPGAGRGWPQDPLRGAQDVQVQRVADELMAQGIDYETALATAQARVGDSAGQGVPGDGGFDSAHWLGPEGQGRRDLTTLPPALRGPGQRFNEGKVAADAVADKCPKCGGHTTKLLDPDDGTCQCHGCKTIFKTKSKPMDKMQPTSRWMVDADLHRQAAGDLPSIADDPVPARGSIADQQGQSDTAEPQHSPHSWTDENGNPLQVGREYEMYSQKFDIPDLVRVEAVKPHGGPIEYTLIGEYGLQHATELSRQEADMDGTTFRPAPQTGDQTGDLSLEQNDDDNTGYSGEPEQSDMSAPAGAIHASVQASGVNRENPTLSWLMEGVPRTAGANYTAMEQRALIDETGTARNADSLDLSGTHYISDADDDQFLFGL